LNAHVVALLSDVVVGCTKDDVRSGGRNPSDVSVVETYAGEWKSDKRSGYGVCERTDGVKFEGEWFNNKKNGYGITTFQDGSVEEGRISTRFAAAADVLLWHLHYCA